MSEFNVVPVPDRQAGGRRRRRKPPAEWVRRVDQFEASIKPDIANLSLELVLRPPRGARGKATWYFGRQTANSAVYVFSTRCREEHQSTAGLMLRRFKSRQHELLAGKIYPAGLKFATVLRDHIGNLPRNNRAQEVTAARKESQSVTLLRFLGETELGQYTRDMSLGFVDWFEAEGNKRSGARSYLVLLKEATGDYCGRKNIEWWDDRILVPERTAGKRTRWLKKHELARLLWACLGCRWDAVHKRWQTREIIDDDGTVRTTRRVVTDMGVLQTRRFLARLIRWAIRSGARHDVYPCMVWGREPDLASIEYVEAGESWFHRRGYEEEDGPKQRPSTLLTRQMKLLAWIWARQDGQARAAGVDVTRHRYVIRRADGSYYPGYIGRPWRDLCTDAGLGRDVIVHTLKHTAVSWCHAKGYSIEDTALMLGTTEDTLRRYYTHWGEELLRRARDAFDDPGRLAKFRTIRHKDPLPSDRVPRGRRRRAARPRRPH